MELERHLPVGDAQVWRAARYNPNTRVTFSAGPRLWGLAGAISVVGLASSIARSGLVRERHICPEFCYASSCPTCPRSDLDVPKPLRLENRLVHFYQ